MRIHTIVFAILVLAAGLSCSRGELPPPPAGVPPWPEWAFSHWVWYDDPADCPKEPPGQTTQECYIQLVDDYLKRDIPVGAIIIDSTWETGFNTFNIDTNLFTTPATMIKWFHDRDVRVFLWVTTMINMDTPEEIALHDEAAEKNYFMTAGEGMSPAILDWWWGEKGGSLIDLFNPEALEWWHSKIDKALELGIDGWKCDGAEYNVSLLEPYSPYLKKSVKRVEYSHAYYSDFFNYTREKLGNDRIITARPVDTYKMDPSKFSEDMLREWMSFAPREINWAGWVGDQDATFEGIRAALVNMYHSSRLGYVAFGSDIGGYDNDDNAPFGLKRTKELLLRWVQLGAVCPVMENGGNGEHRPWIFDDNYGGTETTDIYRTFVKLHYALIPYLMSEGARAFNEGVSLMRFLDAKDFQYFLGRDIFVAPILAEGGSVKISFPGSYYWVYLFDRSKVYKGGTTQTLTFPLSEYPVFLRKGSIIESTLKVP